MSDPVHYFTHIIDGHRSLAVHRLDELVQVTITFGALIGQSESVFLAPTAARAAADAIDCAARAALAHFDDRHAERAEPPASGGLPAWGKAFAFGGLPYTLCPAGDGRVHQGQSAVPETATGRIWHDDCAEAEALLRQSLTCPAPASAPPEARPTAGAVGGAHGAAGAGRSSAVTSRPAAPPTS